MALVHVYLACNAVFMGKQVDGIYDSDPKNNSEAKRYKNISYSKVLSDNLKIMDASAISLARDNDIPIIVFSINNKNALSSIVNGEGDSTLISNILSRN